MPAAVRPVAASRPPPAAAYGRERPLADGIGRLRASFGNAWSFEIVRHGTLGNMIEVVGRLRANGSTVQETAVAPYRHDRSLGELLERAAGDSLRKCVETLLRNGR
jgi:hypothetical protein